MPRIAFAAVLPFLLAARAALGCEYIAADARRFAEELREQGQALNAFEAGLRRMVAACQDASVQLSGRAGAAATAEACVAMRETAEFDRDLAEAGDACAQLTGIARQSLVAFRESKVQPGDLRLETLGKLSETDPDVMKYCPEPARLVRRQAIEARELLERSNAAIATAEEEASKFHGLAEKAKGDMFKNRGAVERCASPAEGRLIASHVSGAGKEVSGAPLNGTSSVTGSLRAKLKLALTDAVVIIGPAEPAYSLAMRPEGADPVFAAASVAPGPKDAKVSPGNSAVVKASGISALGTHAVPSAPAAEPSGGIASGSGSAPEGVSGPTASDVLASFSGALPRVAGASTGRTPGSGSAVGELLVLASGKSEIAQVPPPGATLAVSNIVAADDEDLFRRVTRRLRNREGELASAPHHDGVVKLDVHAGLGGELVVALSPGE